MLGFTSDVKLPRSLVVGPIDYSVGRWHTPDEYGHIEYERAVIALSKELEAGVERETLFHEFLHAVLEHIGYRTEIGDEAEERLVRRLSPSLLAALRDNPKFRAYLFADA